jgi:predicted metal-dependent peptidase
LKKKYLKIANFLFSKKINNADSPDKAAQLIVENKVPYTIAIGLIEKITPSVLIALVNNMTSQEVINNIASPQEKGIMDNPDTKKLVLDKLEKAKKTKNVASLKSKTAKNTGRVKDEEVVKQLDEIADVQIKKSGTIKIPTAIFVDRSGSMEQAISVGKQMAAMVSGATTADLHVIAFDTMAQAIKAKQSTLTSWEEAFKPIRAGGGTSIGCALDFLKRYKMYVEQIVVITDEDENQEPRFAKVYPEYCELMKIKPHVVVVRIGGSQGSFSHDLQRLSISHDIYTPQGKDYYGLPGLIPLLSRKSKLDLVYEIMEFPLPKRKAYV